MIDSITILKAAFNDLKTYSDSTFVIQCSGSVLQDNDLLRSMIEDIVALQNSGINIILIQDGSKVVSSMMDKFTFKGASDNIRITDQANAEIVEMILTGHVNQKVVSLINQSGGYAAGISGKDSQFMVARRAKLARYDYDNNEKILNFGFSGELSLINPDILFLLEDNGLIPVISPIALGDDGKTYKIDASDISGAIAAVLGVKKIIFISDYPGILNSNEEVIYELNDIQVGKIVNEDKKNNDLSSFLRAGLMSLEYSVETVHIIDGKIPHVLLRELFTDELVGSTIKINS